MARRADRAALMSRLLPLLRSSSWSVRVAAARALGQVVVRAGEAGPGIAFALQPPLRFDAARVVAQAIPLLSGDVAAVSLSSKPSRRRRSVFAAPESDWSSCVAALPLSDATRVLIRQKILHRLGCENNPHKWRPRGRGRKRRKVEPSGNAVAHSSRKDSRVKRARRPLPDKAAPAAGSSEEEQGSDAKLGAGGSTLRHDYICEALGYLLLHPRWEARHGAALGLRAILAFGSLDVWAASADVVEVAALGVLGMDQFADFSGDETVAPVVETAAQALALLAYRGGEATAQRIVRELTHLFRGGRGDTGHRPSSTGSWTARHAAMLGVQYTCVALGKVKHFGRCEWLADAVGAVRLGLRDKTSDDVRGAAAGATRALLNLIQDLESSSADSWRFQLISALWGALEMGSEDDLCSSHARALSALCHAYDDRDASSRPLVKLLPPLSRLLPRLVPLVRHKVQAVAEAALKNLSRVAGGARGQGAVDALVNAAGVVVRTIQTDARPRVRAVAAGAMDVVSKALCRRGIWAGHAKMRHDRLVQLFANLWTIPRSQAAAAQTQASDESPGLNKGLEAAGTLGVLLSSLVASAASTGVLEEVTRGLRSNSASDRLRALFAVAKCFEALASAAPGQGDCGSAGLAAARALAREASVYIRAGGVRTPGPPIEASSAVAEAERLAERIVGAGGTKLDFRSSDPARPFQGFSAFVARAKAANTASNDAIRAAESHLSSPAVTRARALVGLTAAVAAAAEVQASRLDALPAPLSATSLNPVIRPLVAGLRVVAAGPLRLCLAASTAELILQLCQGPHPAVSKVLRNLVKMMQPAGAVEASIAVRIVLNKVVERLPDAKCAVVLAPLVPFLVKPPRTCAAAAMAALGCICGAARGAQVKALLAPVLRRTFEGKNESNFESPSTREAAARCIVDACGGGTGVFAPEAFDVVFIRMADWLCGGAPHPARLAAAGTIHAVLSRLGPRASASIVALALRPLLMGLGGDSSAEVRRACAAAFACAARVFALAPATQSPGSDAKGAPTVHLSEALEARRVSEQMLMRRLSGQSALEPFSLPFELIGAGLRSYQRDGIRWLLFLQKYRLGGALCDDMGLGKSVQAACAMAAAASTWTENSGAPPSLVVCPPALVDHWCAEIEKFIPRDVLRPVGVRLGDAAGRGGTMKRACDGDTPVILVLGYPTLQRRLSELKSMRFLYAVLDEGHLICDSRRPALAAAARALQARHRLVLTGTPARRGPIDMWELFEFLMPGYLAPTKRAFETEYSLPVQESRKLRARAARSGRRAGQAAAVAKRAAENARSALARLGAQITPFVLRRTKDDVAAEIPERSVQDVLCSPSSLVSRLLFGKDEAYTEHRRVLAELAAVQRSRRRRQQSDHQQTNHQQTIRGRGGSGGEDSTDLLPRAPGPRREAEAAVEFLRRTCTHPALVVGRGALGGAPTLEQSEKLKALAAILDACGVASTADGGVRQPAALPHRAIVFAQSKGALDLVESLVLRPRLAPHEFARIDDRTPAQQRFQIAERFNADPTVGVLLATVRVAGLGLNLIGADVVIMLEHDVEATRDLQAMDRAHRIGQTRHVAVYRLVTRGTAEEQLFSIERFREQLREAQVGDAAVGAVGDKGVLDAVSRAAAGGTAAGWLVGGRSGGRGRGYGAWWEDDATQYTSEFGVEAFESAFVVRLAYVNSGSDQW